MNIVNNDFINIRAIKKDIEHIKKESKNSQLWQKLQDGFELVSNAMEKIIPSATKITGYPFAVLAIVSQNNILANNEPLKQLVGDMSVSLGITAFGSYAVMLLTSKIYEGIKNRVKNKNFNIDYLLHKTQRKSVELEIELNFRPNTNATKVAKELLTNLNKTLFSKDNEKKLELETEFMFGNKNKPKFKM